METSKASIEGMEGNDDGQNWTSILHTIGLLAGKTLHLTLSM